MYSKNQQAVLRTLVYSDIFNYPLTEKEVFTYLISDQKISLVTVGKEVRELVRQRKIYKRNGFFYLHGRERIVLLRNERVRESVKKIKYALKIVRYISFVPTVLLIGISGALSVQNSSQDDDIDLFIISQKGSLWFTRLSIIILLSIKGLLRKRVEVDVRNKFCLNMLVDESKLELPLKFKNLYGAREVVQMRPVFVRGNVYKKFLYANNWVGSFLPNAFEGETTRNITRNYANSFFSFVLRIVLHSLALEFIARNFQLFYMRKHRSSEIITDTLLAFHPDDYEKKILKTYKLKLKQYKI